MRTAYGLVFRMVFCAFLFLNFQTFWSLPAHAGGSGMPWEQPLEKVLESVQGPVAKVVATLAIIITGLALAFGETSGFVRRGLQIVFGLTIAFTASTFFLDFFEFGGGAII